jgi:hypothetical protein
VAHRLIKDGLIEKETDVIEAFLYCDKDHVKLQLRNVHGLNDRSTSEWSSSCTGTQLVGHLVEVTLAVPVYWGPEANYIMTTCLKAALTRCALPTENGSGPLWFLVDEAEAAATATLRRESDTIMASIQPTTHTFPGLHEVARRDIHHSRLRWWNPRLQHFACYLAISIAPW